MQSTLRQNKFPIIRNKFLIFNKSIYLYIKLSLYDSNRRSIVVITAFHTVPTSEQDEDRTKKKNEHEEKNNKNKKEDPLPLFGQKKVHGATWGSERWKKYLSCYNGTWSEPKASSVSATIDHKKLYTKINI